MLVSRPKNYSASKSSCDATVLKPPNVVTSEASHQPTAIVTILVEMTLFGSEHGLTEESNRVPLPIGETNF